MYELLSNMAVEQEIILKDPLFQSETRFANYASRIYQHMEQDYTACIATLEQIKLEKRGGNSDDREKSREAEDLQLSIQNKKFAILLCGLCDVYTKFGLMVTDLQKVNTLPWQRLDLYKKHISHFHNMLENLTEETHERCNKDIC